jgi:hypothetical protein
MTVVRYKEKKMAIDLVKNKEGEELEVLARLQFPNDQYAMAAYLHRERFAIEVVAVAKKRGRERDQTWAMRLDTLSKSNITKAKAVWSLLSRGFEVSWSAQSNGTLTADQGPANARRDTVFGQSSSRERQSW